MNKLFECEEQKFTKVPDGTLLSPFLNSKDVNINLPWNLLDGLSVAAGQIEPLTVSQIHILPFVSQVCESIIGFPRY